MTQRFGTPRTMLPIGEKERGNYGPRVSGRLPW